MDSLFPWLRIGSWWIFLASPGVVLVWGWTKIPKEIREKRAVNAAGYLAAIPPFFLFLVSLAYALTIAEMFSPSLRDWLFGRFHTGEISLSFFVCLLACVFCWVGKSAMRYQLFIASGLLSSFYFLLMAFAAD